jgi:hypothetical protein
MTLPYFKNGIFATQGLYPRTALDNQVSAQSSFSWQQCPPSFFLANRIRVELPLCFYHLSYGATAPARKLLTFSCQSLQYCLRTRLQSQTYAQVRCCQATQPESHIMSNLQARKRILLLQSLLCALSPNEMKISVSQKQTESDTYGEMRTTSHALSYGGLGLSAPRKAERAKTIEEGQGHLRESNLPAQKRTRAVQHVASHPRQMASLTEQSDNDRADGRQRR